MGSNLPEIDRWGSVPWTETGWNNISSNGRHWPEPETILHPPREFAFACLLAWIVSGFSLFMWQWLFQHIASCPVSTRQALFMRIVCAIPVVTVTGCLQTSFVIYSVFFALIRHCYLGLCLFWTFELVCDRYGGFEGAVQSFGSERTDCLWWFEQPSAPGSGQAGSIAAMAAR